MESKHKLEIQRKDTEFTKNVSEIKREQEALKKTHQASLAEFDMKRQSELTTVKAAHKNELEKLRIESSAYKDEVNR
jgi:hypothetical protein